jgi:uncharacterized membrane protein YhaH (DUF805 family)
MSISKILFSFSGRIPRSTYWSAVLGLWVAFFIFALFLGFISAAARRHTDTSSSGAVVLLVPMYICAIWCGLAVSVKRWHDHGKSGLWVLIGFIPIIGPIWSLIELGFLEGTPGPNQYGDGTYSGDYALAENDPLLSAPQIAGRQCVYCQEKIASFMGAELYGERKDPAHVECHRAHGNPVYVAYP